MELTREITLPVTAEEVWRSLSEPAWLGEDASIDLRPDGDVRAGDRTGFVEEAEEPRRLVFWWSEPGADATRVELELEPDGAETHVRVVESRPLALLDLYGAEIVHALPGPQQPELLAR
ncbi:MAG: hypothetical protein QOH58_2741 [Thermoleophilaceae bacterium]|jgi:uncharacterized protein YndB with AHSA1/START domain|nr:hypothetical protein [Thermoleophilaceae bacterium]